MALWGFKRNKEEVEEKVDRKVNEDELVFDTDNLDILLEDDTSDSFNQEEKVEKVMTKDELYELYISLPPLTNSYEVGVESIKLGIPLDFLIEEKLLTDELVIQRLREDFNITLEEEVADEEVNEEVEEEVTKDDDKPEEVKVDHQSETKSNEQSDKSAIVESDIQQQEDEEGLASVATQVATTLESEFGSILDENDVTIEPLQDKFTLYVISDRELNSLISSHITLGFNVEYISTLDGIITAIQDKMGVIVITEYIPDGLSESVNDLVAVINEESYGINVIMLGRYNPYEGIEQYDYLMLKDIQKYLEVDITEELAVDTPEELEVDTPEELEVSDELEYDSIQQDAPEHLDDITENNESSVDGLSVNQDIEPIAELEESVVEHEELIIPDRFFTLYNRLGLSDMTKAESIIHLLDKVDSLQNEISQLEKLKEKVESSETSTKIEELQEMINFLNNRIAVNKAEADDLNFIIRKMDADHKKLLSDYAEKVEVIEQFENRFNIVQNELSTTRSAYSELKEDYLSLRNSQIKGGMLKGLSEVSVNHLDTDFYVFKVISQPDYMHSVLKYFSKFLSRNGKTKVILLRQLTEFTEKLYLNQDVKWAVSADLQTIDLTNDNIVIQMVTKEMLENILAYVKLEDVKNVVIIDYSGVSFVPIIGNNVTVVNVVKTIKEKDILELRGMFLTNDAEYSVIDLTYDAKISTISNSIIKEKIYESKIISWLKMIGKM